MNRLIVNTANDQLSIVLETKDNVFYKLNNARMHHNETMMPLIDEILTEHDLTINQIEELGVVIGPGSFTGIRVGVATIKAFRDSLNIKAKGINNLDLLFKLANKQYGAEIVAIRGSLDSYFVAKLINGVVYKYDHNLTLEELNNVSEGKIVGMFSKDDLVNCAVVEFDAKVLVDCFKESSDETLVPVYYQLSQAEREKLKKGDVNIRLATSEDIDNIVNIEQSSFNFNLIGKQDFLKAVDSDCYKLYVVTFNNQVAGFVLLQLTDEICIEDIAVDKQFRNLGLATKLICFVCEQFKDAFTTISLEVGEKNIAAFLLYQKLGFKLRRVRKNYYSDGTNCLEMSKNL